MTKMCVIEGEKDNIRGQSSQGAGNWPDRATEFLVPRQRAWLQPWLGHSVLQGPVAQVAYPTLSWHMEQWNTQHSAGE